MSTLEFILHVNSNTTTRLYGNTIRRTQRRWSSLSLSLCSSLALSFYIHINHNIKLLSERDSNKKEQKGFSNEINIRKERK